MRYLYTDELPAKAQVLDPSSHQTPKNPNMTAAHAAGGGSAGALSVHG